MDPIYESYQKALNPTETITENMLDKKYVPMSQKEVESLATKIKNTLNGKFKGMLFDIGYDKKYNMPKFNQHESKNGNMTAYVATFSISCGIDVDPKYAKPFNSMISYETAFFKDVEKIVFSIIGTKIDLGWNNTGSIFTITLWAQDK